MLENKFHCLVVDTTAFINNLSLQDYSEYIITVPEVVKEIKNKRQLKRLCVLPYDLTVDEPSIESVKHVIEFAKKTGDYLSLSSADIKVIALTYQLEKELIGTEHLRNQPIIPKTIASKDIPTELLDRTPIAGFYIPPNEIQLKKKTDSVNKIFQSINENYNELDSGTDELIEELEKLDCNAETINNYDSESENILVPVIDIIEKSNRKIDNKSNENDIDSDDVDDDDDDDDDSSWITPSNIAEIKSSYGKDLSENIVVRVACMSTDYAIQNVLKQMNLNIVAIDGKVIKQIRTYILRCYACYKTTSIMTKIFCPKCGNKTLKRVSVSLDENGQQVIHINTRRPLTAKGKNKSIPRPRGGKHSSNPILFEDQPMPKQMPSRVARTKTNALDEDYIAGFSPFVLRDVDSRSAMLRAAGGTNNIKQWARNNEYQNNLRKAKK